MKIAIGNDHAGLNLKAAIKELLVREGHELLDLGAEGPDAVDYPDYVFPIAAAVTSGQADLGIFACGSGLGPAIAANKVPGIRAVTCHDVFSARSSRRDQDANILTMGERVIGIGAALEVVKVWVDEPFGGVERHQRRIDKITEAETKFRKP
jgi:ribose 5-phosphate isomerase B